MRSSEGISLKLFLTGVVVAVPVILAVHLVQAVSLPLRALNQDQTKFASTESDPAALDAGFSAELIQVAAAQGTAPKSLVTGVLYTKGKAIIDWNGASIPLENGSYAYVGGETIQMAADAIGLLKLADGSSVFICPDSKVRLSRNANSQYSLDLIGGSSRFRFRADKDFQVTVNEVVMSNPWPPNTASPGAFVTAEVRSKQKVGCIICSLKSNLKVTTPTTEGGGKISISAAGEILDVTRNAATQATTLEKTPIPADIMSGLNTAANSSAQGIAYLCRCQAIQKYAKDLAAATTAIARAEVREAAMQSLAQTPPATDSVELVTGASVPPPELAPPVAPPQAPPLALAVPGTPDPFDPNVLPPPAAGGADAPTLLIAPPVVPTAGSGGGLAASPS